MAVGNFYQLGGWEVSHGSVPQLSGVSVSPSLGLMSLLPLQGYHRSNHFIATQGEPCPALSANASSAPDVAARFFSWWG